MTVKKRIDWPPKPHKVKREHGRQVNRDGQPLWIPLNRWSGDRALRGQMSHGCCDCGLVHEMTFEVVREDKGQWWLVKRSYRTGKLGKPLR